VFSFFFCLLVESIFVLFLAFCCCCFFCALFILFFSFFFSSNGYYEIYTNSLIKLKYLGFINKYRNIFILNPLNKLINIFRQSLIFSGLEVILYNINRKQFNLSFFEFGKVYYKENNDYLENNRIGI
jgi:phenylalanyl-tRNA synthetase beta chain